MVAVRDPRDMLLEWLAFGTSMPFALPDMARAAAWLATVLSQLALLVDQQWYPNRVVHTDQIGDDPAAAAAAMSEAMGIELPVPATVGMPRFPPGHWREYAEPLAEPFAQLTPVAVAMGYPER